MVCQSVQRQTTPQIPQLVTDSSGGAIIIWADYRSGSGYDIYEQHVNSSGVVQWAADGVPICTASNSQDKPQITDDGFGGGIIVWEDYRSGSNTDIYAQRVNSNGVVQWTADGVAICTASNNQEVPKLVNDGFGGAVVTWADYRSNNYDIYAQRINSNGVVQWANNGITVCTASNTHWEPQIVNTSLGSSIIVWKDLRSDSYGGDIYAQRLDSNGTAQWTTNGTAICTASQRQENPQIANVGLSGAIITWTDSRLGNSDIFAQKINKNGIAQWISNGAIVSFAPNTQDYPVIIGDGSDGAIIIWIDNRNGSGESQNYDIYAQWLNSPLWPIEFNNVASTAGVEDAGQIHYGVAWGDYDSDGDLDVYVTKGGANYLYRNNGDGTFTDVASAAGVADGGNGYGAAWGDYDNDGDLDLYVVNEYSPNRLYHNENNGTFTEVGSTAGVADNGEGNGVSWVDYDRDGELDLFVANGNSGDLLYHNNGDGTFTDVAFSAGVLATGYSASSAWGDYDNDGDFALYIAKSSYPSVLYRNNSDGTFTNMNNSAGIGSYSYNRGSAWGDYDNDGDLDLYVVSYTGWNILYRNDGNSTFTKVSEPAGVTGGSYDAGISWIDYDNDGDLDLWISNSEYWYRDRLYSNNGDGTFTDMAESVGLGSNQFNRTTGAWGDYDSDGDLDLFESANPNRFYKNGGGTNNWLSVKLVGVVSNKSAIGARVIVRTGSLRQIREVDGGSGLYSQPSLPVEFGLGSATSIDSVIIQWPNGILQWQTEVAVNQILNISENTYSDIETAVLGTNLSFNENADGHTVEMNFSNITGSGNVTIQQINASPSNAPCINVCDYHWEITKDANISSFSADLTFHYTDSDASGYTESSAYLGIAKFNSSTNTWQWLGGTVDAVNNTVTVSSVNSFSTFALFRRIFGDITGDGYVDAADLQRLGDCWHQTNSGEFTDGSDARSFNFNKNTDGGNQIIDAADLQVFGDCWHNGIEP